MGPPEERHMTTTPSETIEELNAIIADDATRTEPLEEYMVMVDETIVVYIGPGEMYHVWSAVEKAARDIHGLIKDRDLGDATDPRESTLFKDDTLAVEIKGASAGPVIGGVSPGRFAIRRGQHRRLVDAGADYVLVVYSRLSGRAVYIADTVRISADTMDAIIREQGHAWSPRDSDGEQEAETRLRWTELPFFDTERIQRTAYVMQYAF